MEIIYKNKFSCFNSSAIFSNKCVSFLFLLFICLVICTICMIVFIFILFYCILKICILFDHFTIKSFLYLVQKNLDIFLFEELETVAINIW